MNRGVARILEFVRMSFLYVNRAVERVLRRLKEAQDNLTDTVRNTIPDAARLKSLMVRRVLAKGIDMILVVVLAYQVPVVGPFVGFIYSIFADGFYFWGFRGQSLGKRVLGLRVHRRGSQLPGNWRDSGLRNLPAGVATFFAMIPLWGWVIFVVMGIPLTMIELFLMMRMEDQMRLGDIMADTQVVRVR